MSNLDNIEKFIEMYEGTSIGQSVKHMLDNGEPYEKICEFAAIDYDDEDKE